MRPKRSSSYPLLGSVYLFLLFFCCLTQVARSQDSSFSGGDFTEFKLDNGLRVIFLEDSSSQDFMADLLVDYPLVLEGEHRGIGVLVTKGLSAGTKSHSKAEIEALLRSANCTLEASVQGQLQTRAPIEERETVLSLLAELVQEATFPEEELAQLKAASERIIMEGENSVFDQSLLLANQLSFGADHPYGQRMKLESLANISSVTCQQFYKKYYRPIVSYLVVTGNLPAKEVRLLVEKYFGNWQVQGAMFAAFHNPAPLPLSTRLSFVNVPGAADLSLDIGYSIPLRPGTDDELKVALLRELLEKQLSSVSWDAHNREKFIFGADPHIGFFRVLAADFSPEMAEEIISDILAALGSLRNELVDSTSLAAAKATLLTKDFRFRNFLSNSNRKANEALSIVRFKLPPDYYENDLQRINEMTAADVLEVAREYLLPGRAHIVVAGDQAIAPSLARFAGDGKVHYYTREGKEIEAMDWELATENITAEAVIERYLAAIGGRSRLAAVKDITWEATAEIQVGTLTMIKIKKNDEMFFGQHRIGDLNILKVFFDGQSAREFQGNEEAEVSEEALDKIRTYAVIFPELQYHNEGYQLEVAGSAVLNQRNVHTIEVTTPTGTLTTQYFDADNGLLVRSMTEENGKIQIWDYLDYRAVEGIKFPHQSILTGLFEDPLLYRVKNIKLNQGVPDELFKVED